MKPNLLLILTLTAAVAGPSHAQARVDPASRRPELRQALMRLGRASVFFAFDDSTLTPEAKSVLVDVGAILVRHPRLKARIVGNCDERGSDEYNLALGQRRAYAAMLYLREMGVHDDQLSVASSGSKKPTVLGHGQAARRQNRRDDLAVFPDHGA